MSHSGIPGIEELGGFMAGDEPPHTAPPPAPPTTGTETQAAEERQRRGMGGGESANILAPQDDFKNTKTSKTVLLGS